MTRSLPWSLLVALLAAPFLSSCSRTNAAEQQNSERLIVRRGNLQEQFVLTGEVEARRGLTIAVPKIPNWETTIKWLAEDGKQVRKGEKVAELDSSSFSGGLEQKRISATEARQQLAQHDARVSSDLDDKTFEHERRRLALETAKVAAAVPDSIISRREYQERQLELRRATIEYEKATELLASAKKAAEADRRNFLISIATSEQEIATAEKAITDMALFSDADGILITGMIPWEGRKLQIGDRVWVGFPIGTIPDMSTLQIVANLWDVDDGRVKVGDGVSVTIDAFPQREFGGKIVSIAPVAQETSPQALRRAFKTVIVLDRIDPEVMRPGFSARCVIKTTATRGALLAPRSAIRMDGSRALLLLADGGEKEIKLGACNAQECVVTGVEEGTRLRSIAEASDDE